jgi:hypothetical protein
MQISVAPWCVQGGPVAYSYSSLDAGNPSQVVVCGHDAYCHALLDSLSKLFKEIHYANVALAEGGTAFPIAPDGPPAGQFTRPGIFFGRRRQ